MRDFKIVTQDAIPCWYELSWRGKQGIVLRIHSDFAGREQIPDNAPIIGHYAKEFGFSKFGYKFGENFGFEESLRFLGEVNGFLEYAVPTPLVRKNTGENCSSCNGSGKSEVFEGEECLYCSGEGKDVVYDYAEAFAVSATLTVLFGFMMFPEVETSCSLPQLICVHTVTIKRSHGGSIGGEYSREAVEWMRRCGPGEIPEMVSAMRVVWEKMDGRMMEFYEHSFRANLSNGVGWLCTDLPGDACGLHPSHNASYEIERGRGCEFSSHNVDNPMQQLVILASLAALHDLVRKGRR